MILQAALEEWLTGMIKRILFSFIIFCAGPAYSVEWETLLEHESWRLDVNLYDDGDMSCEARSVSDDDIVISFLEWKDGTSSVSFYKSVWKFPDESIPTDFLVAIDDLAPWHMSGSRVESSIMLTTNDAEKKNRFLREVRNGAILTLYNDERVRVGEFRLNGSAYVLSALSECRNRIIENTDQDPFAKSSSSVSDPF